MTLVQSEPKSIKIWTPSRLPEEYQEVEHIETTWTQWIDTWLIWKSWYKIDLKYYTNSSSNRDQTIVWCSVVDWDTPLYRWVNYNSSYMSVYFNYNNTWHDIRNSQAVWNTYEWSVTLRNWNQNITLNWNTVYSATDNLSQTWTTNLFLFTSRWTNYALIKLYYMKIYDENDNLIRDFVPCYRKADDVIWLYDLVNSQFYTNSWTWTFTKWADIVGEKEIKKITIRQNWVEKVIRPTWFPKWRIDEWTQWWSYSLWTWTMGWYMTEDGAYYFSANEVGNTITRYTLATPYVLSWYTATQQKTGLSICHQVCFKPDGTKMFVACYWSNNIRVFNLSTAWDLSTATETTAFGITQPTACFITENGNHLYSSYNNNNILHYTLSTPFDTTTATLSDSAASPSGACCRWISISPDGKHLFITDTTNYRIIQTELTTSYVVSTFASDTKYYLPQTQISSWVMVMWNVSSSWKYLFYSNSRQYVVRIDMTWA